MFQRVRNRLLLPCLVLAATALLFGAIGHAEPHGYYYREHWHYQYTHTIYEGEDFCWKYYHDRDFYDVQDHEYSTYTGEWTGYESFSYNTYEDGPTYKVSMGCIIAIAPPAFQ